MMTHDANQRKSGLFRKPSPDQGPRSFRRKSGLFRKPARWLLGLLPLLTGCVYSLQPWYAEGSGGADPALRGVWREADGKDTWVFLAAGDSLRLLFQGENELGEFTAVTFSHGDWNFLDLTPAGTSLPGGTVGWYMHPLHGLHHWQIAGDTLLLGSLDINALNNLLASVPHPPLENGENRSVFMGSREEMATFVPERLLNDSLFSDRTVLVRQ